MKKMVTVRIGEAAQAMNVDPRTVRSWMRRGLLEYVLLPNGERRIPQDRLDAILAVRREKDTR